MLQPVITILTGIQAQLLLIVPIVAIICLTVYGIVMTMGDHAKGRMGVIWAIVGTAISLGAATMVGAIHV